MMEALRHAQRYDPEYPRMLQGMAMGFYALNQYDSAYVYAEKLIRVEPSYARAYLVAGASAHRLRLRSRAKVLLNNYLGMNPPDGPEKSTAESILNQLQ